MKLSYRLALPLVALSLALAVAPALAAKPAPTPIALPGGPSHVNGTSVSCQLGNTAADQAAVWFFASDDYYYELIDPAQCGCAEGGAVKSLTANWMLFYQTPCTLQLQVWVVNAIDTGGGCFIPDAGPGDPPDPTAAETFCGPTAIISQPGSGLFVHSVPLPDCACTGDKKFVLFKIVGPGDCPTDTSAPPVLQNPLIVYENTTPGPCESYNGFLGGPPTDMLTFGFPGNITMWVDADCCPPTGTLPGSWGGLKTLYR